MLVPFTTGAASQLSGYGGAGCRFRARLLRAWADIIDPPTNDGLEPDEFRGQPIIHDNRDEPTDDDFQRVALEVLLTATADDVGEDIMTHLDHVYREWFFTRKRNEGSI